MMQRLTLGGALTAMLSASGVARAQDSARAEPRLSALIAGAIGTIPQLTSPDAGGGRAIVGTAAGARLRPVRHVTIDALAAVHFPSHGEFLTGAQDAPIRTRRRFDDRIGRVGTFASAHARLGVEGGAGPNGALFRVAAGAGYMSGLGEPFTSVTGGIGSRGRRVRATMEVERWWFGLPAIAVTYPGTLLPSGQPAPSVTTRYRSRERATHLRLGLEVPLRRPRR